MLVLLLGLLPGIFIFLSGCAASVKRVAITPEATYTSPETALLALATSSPATTITATARIEIIIQGERHPFKAAVMMKRPAHLRLESIPLLGPPDFFLSLTEGELRVFLPTQGTFYMGRATTGNISRFFPLPLPPADIIPLLMGHPPDLGGPSSSWRGEREGDLYRLDQYRAGAKIRSLWIDPVGGQPSRIQMFSEDEKSAYTAVFSEYTHLETGVMPQRLTITTGGHPSLSVRYTDIRPLSDDAASFALPIPDNTLPLFLD